MASVGSSALSDASPEAVPLTTPLPVGRTTLSASSVSPIPALATTTIHSNPALNNGLTSGALPVPDGTTPILPNASPTNSSLDSGSDTLTASPVYLFIFAIALGALIILSLTIVIRSVVLRQRLIALHGPDWRRQHSSTILEMLGLSSRRMWADLGTQPGPQTGRRRRRDHGQKPVLVEVYVGEGKSEGCWKDVQVGLASRLLVRCLISATCSLIQRP
jgi:hypothetical protein